MSATSEAQTADWASGASEERETLDHLSDYDLDRVDQREAETQLREQTEPNIAAV